MASTVGVPSSGCLLYVIDSATGISFLVHSGAQVSLLPRTAVVNRSKLNKLKLQAVNISLMHTYWEKCIQRTFTQNIHLHFYSC